MSQVTESISANAQLLKYHQERKKSLNVSESAQHSSNLDQAIELFCRYPSILAGSWTPFNCSVIVKTARKQQMFWNLQAFPISLVHQLNTMASLRGAISIIAYFQLMRHCQKRKKP